MTDSSRFLLGLICVKCIFMSSSTMHRILPQAATLPSCHGVGELDTVARTKSTCLPLLADFVSPRVRKLTEVILCWFEARRALLQRSYCNQVPIIRANISFGVLVISNCQCERLPEIGLMRCLFKTPKAFLDAASLSSARDNDLGRYIAHVESMRCPV